MPDGGLEIPLRGADERLTSADPPPERRARHARQRALLEGLRRADPRAQAALFRLYERPVRRVLTRILDGNLADVADALQDTFVKVFRSAGAVQDPLALGGWVVKVAESVGLDEFRRRERGRARCRSAWSRQVHCSVVAPIEVRSALRDACGVLAALPESEQQVFTLRFIHGLELAKIAEQCAVSVATVKRRLQRASSRFSALARRRPDLNEWVGGRRRVSCLAEAAPHARC